ncbi:MAG TPA: hypothetical protein VLJ37_00655, partial [bacterium]|nr:hypothetical protein [bacterium]
LPATLTPGDAPVLTASGTPVVLSVPGTLTEAPVERPTGTSYISLGHSFGPGRDPSPEDMKALNDRGRFLPALQKYGSTLVGAGIPNSMPPPRSTGDGFSLADSSVGSCTDEGGSGTDRPEGGARVSRARPGKRDLNLGYIRCGIRG